VSYAVKSFPGAKRLISRPFQAVFSRLAPLCQGT
jgi:hypothetical protein